MICAGYGWTPADVRDLTPSQVGYFLNWLPLIELRRHLPVAQLEAAVRNVMGGKPEAGKQGAGLPPHRRYSAYELLPSYARPEGLDHGIPPEAAADFFENLHLTPEWVLQVVPIDQLRASRS